MPPERWKTVSVPEEIYNKVRKRWEARGGDIEVRVGDIVMSSGISFSYYVALLLERGMDADDRQRR